MQHLELELQRRDDMDLCNGGTQREDGAEEGRASEPTLVMIAEPGPAQLFRYKWCGGPLFIKLFSFILNHSHLFKLQ